LEKNLYYQEGWLAAGNANSVVGCIYTTCLTEQQREMIRKHKESTKNTTPSEPNQVGTITNAANPASSNSPSNETPVQSSLNTNLNRTNFNLRGHKSEIKLVKWNEPYQKLASCDANGVIYVWVKYEGRWSIELINDRGNCVSDFAWSHDGRMAAICYQDGFVLVGSVNGQRFWSHLYDLSNSQITTATWTPNDLFIILGLSNGNLMVIDENGSVVSRHFLKNDSISHLEYNSPKFFIDELHTDYNNDKNENSNQNSDTRLRFSFTNEHRPFSSPTSFSRNKKINNNNYMLTGSFKSSGSIYLMRNCEDIDPIIIDTKLNGNCYASR
jgi:WD40 repeat protein